MKPRARGAVAREKKSRKWRAAASIRKFSISPARLRTSRWVRLRASMVSSRAVMWELDRAFRDVFSSAAICLFCRPSRATSSSTSSCRGVRLEAGEAGARQQHIKSRLPAATSSSAAAMRATGYDFPMKPTAHCGACARGECRFFVARDHQAGHEGVPGAEQAQPFEAVLAAQAVVDQHDVRRALRGAFRPAQRQGGLHLEWAARASAHAQSRHRTAGDRRQAGVSWCRDPRREPAQATPSPRRVPLSTPVGVARARASVLSCNDRRRAAARCRQEAGAGAVPVAGLVLERRADAGASLWRISWQMASLTTGPPRRRPLPRSSCTWGRRRSWPGRSFARRCRPGSRW